MRLGGRPTGGLAAALTAVAVAGCGLSLGGGSGASGRDGTRAAVTRAAVTRAAVTRAQRSHEIPTPAPRLTAPGGWRSPVQAVQVFAQAYINWTAATIGSHLRTLAYVSVGQAHSAMSMAAAQTARDSDLQRGGIANSGTVEAIAPVTGQRNVYAVVTRERTTAANTTAYRGLAATWHVTLATVVQVEQGLWTLSGWQPKS
jgi:hypothetical protein